MRGDLPEGLEAIWASGDYVGKNRPIGRVTVRRPKMSLSTYAMQSTFRRVPAFGTGVASFNPYPHGIDPTRGEPVTNVYADYLFAPEGAPKELPNVKSISWQRTTDADVAECTVEFYNTSPLPLGVAPESGDLDRPGFFTAGRGTAAFSSRWKHTPNEWQGMLMPDNLLYTYEGYGTDTALGQPIGGEGYVPPERDTKLVQTGVWMIDEVQLDHRGALVVTCRDMGRLLMDHLNWHPVVPTDFYPFSIKAWDDKVTVQAERNIIEESNNVERLHVTPLGSGNDRWPGSSYSGANVYGHTHAHAFDGNPSTYWLSVGNQNPAAPSAYEYVDFTPHGATVTQLRFSTVMGGYTAYVSVEVNGQWLPGPRMPYRRNGIGKYDEGVPYVAIVGTSGEGEHVINLGPYAGVTRIRLWLGNVQNFNLGGVHRHRAAIRELSAHGPVYRRTERRVVDVSQVNLVPGPAGSNPGTVRDYTDAVKLMCAWAGLFWPSAGKEKHSDGTTHQLAPAAPDSEVLGKEVDGRVWGDFQQTGTAPVAEITAQAFDKKTLMEGIAYLRDTLGFSFWIDETGAAQWRMPNIWTLGNWISGMSANPGRTNKVLTIDERQVLLGLDATIQSRNVREGIFVANMVGKMGAMVGGYNPNDTGLRRVGGYSDQHFNSTAEAKVMADLIAVRQMFKYRSDRVRIPAHPGIQIDDQVRIFERVTSEGFVHYVKGVSSSMDMASGKWLMTLQTHWLGDDPNGQWVVDKSTLDSNTQRYVDALEGIEWTRSGI